LYEIKEAIGKITDYSEDNPLNTASYKKKNNEDDDVTAFCFQGDRMFSGYGDGLICFWDLQNHKGPGCPPMLPLIGHTNKVVHIEAIEGFEKIYSSSNDCTLRQWSIDLEKGLGFNERIFKFDDPVLCSKIHLDKNMLFTGCWDKQIRAIMLDTGVVDKTFIAS